MRGRTPVTTHRIVVQRDDDVAFPGFRALARTAALDTHDEDATLALQTVEASRSTLERHVLSGDPVVGPPHAAVPDQMREDELGRVDRYRETDPLGRENHGGVHADHLSARVEERAAGGAPIEHRPGAPGAHLRHLPASAWPRGVPGTGIGLAIRKEVVEAHGGEIGVRSEERRGTTLSFTVPLDPAEGFG